MIPILGNALSVVVGILSTYSSIPNWSTFSLKALQHAMISSSYDVSGSQYSTLNKELRDLRNSQNGFHI